MAKPIPQELLLCPLCKTDQLLFTAKTIYCQHCGQRYAIQANNTYCFVAPPDLDKSFLESIKEHLKRFPKLYSLLITVVSPVCPTDSSKQKKLISQAYLDNKEAVIVNLGSGSSNMSSKVSNVDIYPYADVDMTCDINSLPFKNDSVDMVFSIAVLEHVPSPEHVVAEILRILKPGGTVYCLFPFMQGFHAAPYDYSRRSQAGLYLLFKDFKTIELSCAGGPTSGFLWVFQEWLAILFSFGIVPIYNLIHLGTMISFWPIKFIDLILIKHPQAKNISSSFVFVGTKPESNGSSSRE
jgi:SAM-dependent methyltransferase